LMRMGALTLSTLLFMLFLVFRMFRITNDVHRASRRYLEAGTSHLPPPYTHYIVHARCDTPAPISRSLTRSLCTNATRASVFRISVFLFDTDCASRLRLERTDVQACSPSRVFDYRPARGSRQHHRGVHPGKWTLCNMTCHSSTHH
jgi:hypothetical protein